MIKDYWIYLKNLSFPPSSDWWNLWGKPFSRPRKDLQSSSMIRSMLKKRPMMANVKNSKGSKRLQFEEDTIQQKRNQTLPSPSTFSSRDKKVITFQNSWSRTMSLLAKMEVPSYAIDLKDPRYCPFHMKRGHSLEQCLTFTKLGEILFQKGAANTTTFHLLSIMIEERVYNDGV